MDKKHKRNNQADYDANFDIVNDRGEECEEHKREVDPRAHPPIINDIMGGLGKEREDDQCDSVGQIS